MNLGFFSCGQHADIARYMLESAQKHMPHVRVCHLTDGESEALAEPIRIPAEMPLVVKRLTFYASLPGEWLYVDTDVVFQQDVSHVFEKDFDIAVCDRAPESKDCQYGRMIPYNLGVVFSRTPAFWKSLIPAVETLPPKVRDWDGGQLVMSFAITRKLWPGKVEILPCSYNFTPQTREEDVSQHAIVHYKGKRKGWVS